MSFFKKRKVQVPVDDVIDAEFVDSPSLEGKVMRVPHAETALIASIRTGLISKDDAIMARIPADYENRTVAEVVRYLVTNDVADSKLSIAKSVNSELDSRGSIIMINGKTAALHHIVGKYVTDGNHKSPDGTVHNYRGLEIEVSSVQQGGLYL